MRGFVVLRARNDPKLVPMPRPSRNAARINEKVYTVAPNNSDSSRVQITSAESAVNPDNAIVAYTSGKFGDGPPISEIGGPSPNFALLARARLMNATAMLRVIATNVAMATSYTRSR